MTYVQGFLLAVPNANKAAYKKMAEAGGEIFRKNGAISTVENWGVDVPDGKTTSFPMAVKLKEDETVVFSWVIWPDKQTADAGMTASMEAFGEICPDPSQMPFDGMRMMWAGFETIVNV